MSEVELLTTESSKGGVCRRRTTLAVFESLAIPPVQEVVFLADFRSSRCQQRVAEIMNKMNETQSVVISVLEKKVTLTCASYPNVGKLPGRQLASVHRNPWGKVSLIVRLFRTRKVT